MNFMWYPNFAEYVKTNEISKNIDKIYFSLGNKEKNSKIGISTSENTLKSYSGINWISGKRLGTSKNDVTSWVKSLNY